MQAGRLRERISIYRGVNELAGIAGGTIRKAEPVAVAYASVKIDNGSYTDDMGGYVASQDVTFEFHYHLRDKLVVGGVIKRADRVINLPRVDGTTESEVLYELYEIISVEPNRYLNRVYVKGRLLKTEKKGLGL